MLFVVPALVSVKCCMFMYDFSRLVTRWTAALCLAIMSPLTNLFLHRERRCGLLSLLFLGHRVQLGFMYM